MISRSMLVVLNLGSNINLRKVGSASSIIADTRALRAKAELTVASGHDKTREVY